MLWHETSNPAVVVMLTPTHEAGREKCFQYFPQSMEESVMRVDESDEFGVAFTASVTLLSMTNDRETNCTIRKLEMTVPVTDAGLTGNTTQNAGDTDSDDDSNAATSLSISESNSTADASNNATVEDRSAKKSRIVWHLLYEAWPDYFLPEDINRASLLSLIRLSADRADSAAFAHSGQRNPRIVHCSAGVGRSGTFIALDFLLTELEEGALDAPPYGTEASGVVGQSESEEQEELLLQAEEYDPVFAVVDQLRRQRMMMVQSEAQFAFLYEVLREKWLERRKLVGDFSDES